jgi:peptide/nickel transport system permease protein
VGIRSSQKSLPSDDANATETEGIPILAQAERVSRRETVWHRYRRHRLALIGLIIIVTLAVLAVFAPLVIPHGPYSLNLTDTNQPPNSTFWLGTDPSGRDVLSRLLHAGRISLTVGVTVVIIGVAIGMTVGATAGYFGGWVDSLLMRFVDVVLSFPTILVVIAIIAIIGPSLMNLIIAMGLLAWPPIARLLRADFLSLRERDFILAARAVGVPGARLVVRHMIPNAMAPVIVAATFGVAQAILLEAGLSFLGMGIRRPTPSWGNMLADAQSLTVLESLPWLWIPAGLMITLTILAINFMGDGLRDALDPRLGSR